VFLGYEPTGGRWRTQRAVPRVLGCHLDTTGTLLHESPRVAGDRALGAGRDTSHQPRPLVRRWTP
jgi:hypothetical protein